MAPNPKSPRQPRKPSGGGPRRGRPRKESEEAEDQKRPNMPLPASLLDTTISDGEEYRPGTGAAAAGRGDAPERGNEQVPQAPPPAAAPGPAAPAPQDNGGAPPSQPHPHQQPRHFHHPHQQQGGGRHDRYFDRNRDRRHGQQPGEYHASGGHSQGL